MTMTFNFANPYGYSDRQMLGRFDVPTYLGDCADGTIRPSAMGYFAGWIESDGTILAVTAHAAIGAYSDGWARNLIRFYVNRGEVGFQTGPGVSVTDAQCDAVRTLWAIVEPVGGGAVDNDRSSRFVDSVEHAVAMLRNA
jgi:hypothetical protein